MECHVSLVLIAQNGHCFRPDQPPHLTISINHFMECHKPPTSMNPMTIHPAWMSQEVRINGDRINGLFHLLINGSLSQWLNFKLFGITYLVGKIKFNLFFQVPLAK